MTFYYEDHDKVVDGNAEIMTDNSEMYVKAGVTIGSKNGFDGVDGASNGSIQVYGAIIGLGGNAFYSAGGNNEIHIGIGGSISGSLTANVYGLGIAGSVGNNHVVNDGTISGNTALGLFGPGNIVDNNGFISSSKHNTIYLDHTGGTINNTGTITAANNIAVEIEVTGSGDTTIDNSGSITGGLATTGTTEQTAIRIGAGTAVIKNTGHIHGAIDFAEGSDAYYGGDGRLDGPIYGGGGDDILICGAGKDLIEGQGGSDTLDGGAGRDTFLYFNVDYSSGLVHDTLAEFDFRQDKLQLFTHVAAIDNTVATGKLDDATFNADLRTALKGHLKAHDAILFTPNSGDNAGHTFLIVDADGKAGFISGHDYTFDLQDAVNLTSLDPLDFI